MNWMNAWGIIGNPAEFKGKTIEAVEKLTMENVCTERTCILFKFTDGSRGWVLGGRDSSHLAVDPSGESLSKSMIITPQEFAEYQGEKHGISTARFAQRVTQHAKKPKPLSATNMEIGDVMATTLPETEEETINLINSLRVQGSKRGQARLINFTQPFYLLPFRSEEDYAKEISLWRSILGEDPNGAR